MYLVWLHQCWAQSREKGEWGGGCYCTSWAEMRSSCWVLCYFQLSPLPILPSHFPKHCFFTLCLPSSPGSYEALLQLCFRPRSWWTTKRVVIGQFPALAMKPLDPHLCVFCPPIPQPLRSHPGLCSKPSTCSSLCLPFFFILWLSVCFWWQCFCLSTSSHCLCISSCCPFLSFFWPLHYMLTRTGFSTWNYSYEFTRCLSSLLFPPRSAFCQLGLWIKHCRIESIKQMISLTHRKRLDYLKWVTVWNVIFSTVILIANLQMLLWKRNESLLAAGAQTDVKVSNALSVIPL